MGIDVSLVGNLIALTYVDVATRFTYVSQLANNEPDAVGDDALFWGAKHYGLREKFTGDSSEEFSAS